MKGAHARRAARTDPSARREQVLECFARHFGPAARSPREYRDQDWSAEPFTRGCYAAIFPPGVWTSYGHALREPVGRIHWAGTETAREWMGYFEGALEAGEPRRGRGPRRPARLNQRSRTMSQLLVHGGTIVTQDATNVETEALLVDGDVVTATGAARRDRQRARARRGPP